MNDPKFANLHMHTDIVPYEIIRVVGEKTIEVRQMKYEKDPAFKAEWVVGGFAGHCTNQREQKWNISVDETAPIIRARLRKDGNYHSAYGKHRVSDRAIAFYDYNF